MKRLLLLICTAIPTFIFAASNSCWDWCCGSFEGGAELLFLRPSLCDLNYAIEDPRDATELSIALKQDGAVLPQGFQKAIDCHYNWGFRLFVGYVNDCTCFDIRAQYTWLHDREKDTPKHPGFEKSFWPTFGQPEYLSFPLVDGPAKSELKAELHARANHDYDAVDVEAGMRKMAGCDLWIRAFLGLHYTNINHCFGVHYIGHVPAEFNPIEPVARDVDITVKDHRQIWAIGPKLGIEGIYDIACGFGVGGRATIGILAGNTHGCFSEFGTLEARKPDNDNNNHNHNESEIEAETTTTPTPTPTPTPVPFLTTIPVNLRNRYGDKCVVLPYADMRLGVNYTWCCGCFNFVAEFGYEFISYINAVARQTFNDEAATASTDCQSFNLDGFYLSFRITL